jgi:hypothetical protein
MDDRGSFTCGCMGVAVVFRFSMIVWHWVDEVNEFYRGRSRNYLKIFSPGLSNPYFSSRNLS